MNTAVDTPEAPRFRPLVDGELVTAMYGRIRVSLQKVRVGAYQVTVYQGETLRLEDLCGSYEDESTARTVARGYAAMFKAEATS